MSDYRQILKIALPAVSGFLGLLFFDLINIFWISKLGTPMVAGVAAAGFLEQVIISISGATATGCASLVAQAIGEKNQSKAYQVARESVHLSLLMSVALTLIVLLWGSDTLGWMNLSPVAHDAAMTYLKIYGLGNVIYYLLFIFGQIFNAYGDTKTSVLILTGVLILNAILDPFFIFGWWIFPAWGVKGAAIASLISCGVGVLVRFYYLRKKAYIGSLFSFFTWSRDYSLSVLKIGVPTSLSHVIWSLVYPMLTSLITRFGMAPLAGLAIAHRLEGIAYFSAYGFSIAMTSLIGQAVGRGDWDAAKRLPYQGMKLISMFLFPVALVFVAVPEFLISISTDDIEVIYQGAKYLRIVGFLEIFLGWEMVFEGSFSGLGNTRPYMLISVPLTLGRYPAAYFLVNKLSYGVTAIWWAISISTALKGISMSITFRESARSRSVARIH